MRKVYTVGEKECGIKYCVFKKHTAHPVIHFPMIFPSMLQLFFIFFGTGFEVLAVVRIYNAVWLRKDTV
jgi:hypothetical protein